MEIERRISFSGHVLVGVPHSLSRNLCSRIRSNLSPPKTINTFPLPLPLIPLERVGTYLVLCRLLGEQITISNIVNLNPLLERRVVRSRSYKDGLGSRLRCNHLGDLRCPSINLYLLPSSPRSGRRERGGGRTSGFELEVRLGLEVWLEVLGILRLLLPSSRAVHAGDLDAVLSSRHIFEFTFTFFRHTSSIGTVNFRISILINFVDSDCHEKRDEEEKDNAINFDYGSTTMIKCFRATKESIAICSLHERERERERFRSNETVQTIKEGRDLNWVGRIGGEK